MGRKLDPSMNPVPRQLELGQVSRWYTTNEAEDCNLNHLLDNPDEVRATPSMEPLLE